MSSFGPPRNQMHLRLLPSLLFAAFISPRLTSASSQHNAFDILAPSPTPTPTPTSPPSNPLDDTKLKRQINLSQLTQAFNSFTAGVESILQGLIPSDILGTDVPALESMVQPSSIISSIHSAESSVASQISAGGLGGGEAFSILTANVGSLVSSLSANMPKQTQGSTGSAAGGIGKVEFPFMVMSIVVVMVGSSYGMYF